MAFSLDFRLAACYDLIVRERTDNERERRQRERANASTREKFRERDKRGYQMHCDMFIRAGAICEIKESGVAEDTCSVKIERTLYHSNGTASPADFMLEQIAFYANVAQLEQLGVAIVAFLTKRNERRAAMEPDPEHPYAFHKVTFSE